MPKPLLGTSRMKLRFKKGLTQLQLAHAWTLQGCRKLEQYAMLWSTAGAPMGTCAAYLGAGPADAEPACEVQNPKACRSSPQRSRLPAASLSRAQRWGGLSQNAGLFVRTDQGGLGALAARHVASNSHCRSAQSLRQVASV